MELPLFVIFLVGLYFLFKKRLTNKWIYKIGGLLLVGLSVGGVYYLVTEPLAIKVEPVSEMQLDLYDGSGRSVIIEFRGGSESVSITKVTKNKPYSQFSRTRYIVSGSEPGVPPIGKFKITKTPIPK